MKKKEKLDIFLEGVEDSYDEKEMPDEEEDEEKEEMSEESFTRRHFQMVADILKNYTEGGDSTAKEVASSIAQEFAEMFTQDNPRFDQEKFLKAAGL